MVIKHPMFQITIQLIALHYNYRLPLQLQLPLPLPLPLQLPDTVTAIATNTDTSNAAYMSMKALLPEVPEKNDGKFFEFNFTCRIDNAN